VSHEDLDRNTCSTANRGGAVKEKLPFIWEMLRKSYQEWRSDNATQLAAAIAYYTIFSIPSLLIISLSIAGFFINVNIAQNQLITQIARLAGAQTAEFISSLLVNSTRSSNGILASIISLVVLLVGASGVFYQVQHALNTIWDVPRELTAGFLKTLKNHFQSFLMVLTIAFLLLLFLILSTVMSILISYMNGGAQNRLFPEIINLLVLFVIITIMFALVYRVVPDKEISWTDVWLGAAVTAFLFLLGRYGIGLYLSISNSGSAYGAAGSFIVLLVWIYYSAQIFLWGAEFTQVYSRMCGSRRT
jgi:membrane protein